MDAIGIRTNVERDNADYSECEIALAVVGQWNTSIDDCDSRSTASNDNIPRVRHVIAVEILLHPCRTCDDDYLPGLIIRHIKNTIFGPHHPMLPADSARRITISDLSQILNLSQALRQYVREISFEEANGLPVVELTRYKDAKWCFYMYKMQDGAGSLASDESQETPAATHHVLPCLQYHRLWECLIYDVAIKKDLLNYAMDIVLFSNANIDSNLVTWNKVVLLHGPPGTGKTSLCKALAQKLSIRMVEYYPAVYFMEINSHSLFSKWFSESGKLVGKLFHDIEEIIKQKSAPLVCLLLDEVESLAKARQAAVSGNEPSDAIRAVNALLTQIDKIKKYPNVLILTTSNISAAIDLAFVDRADIKQYIGNPSCAARESILLSSLKELIKKGILLSDPGLFSTEETPIRSLLKRVSGTVSDGMSGRTLRRIPFITHALKFPGVLGVGVRSFLEAMEVTMVAHQSDVTALGRC